MPGSAREVGNALEEGVEFVWLSSPKKFLGSKYYLINKTKSQYTLIVNLKLETSYSRKLTERV